LSSFTPAVALVAALLLAGGDASAQSVVPNGRLLASNCFQCHGTNGQGPGFERLSDKSAREIFKELREMKSDDDDDLMAHHARGYTNAQLRALSRYLSRQR
jgi:cytochrome c553